MGRLNGRVAIVTGAAQGMGEATARLFLEEGARVLLTDIDLERGAALAAELGGEAAFRKLDVADADDWARAVQTATELFGGVDILVNNAGYYKALSLLDSHSEEFGRHVEINDKGTFLGMQAVVAPMRAAGRGAVVNIASVAGLRGGPGMFSYGAAKWAVRGMTRSAAHDLAPFHIRVNAVLPGPIDTQMINTGNDPALNAAITERTLLKRMGQPREVAMATLFLASDEASYVTGTEIIVDGGYSA
ncbi:SDR family NAD(P)-dependent oxidoreductase [Sphingobium chlorophenolicum]|uniref:3-oxoacyl-(Acyl-carrier-protein) reductase n=1 Tax=Sphingobium chlorophenolicum TaxID=46429 RepID=A0A081RBZ9_SPHCR|nr:glucose 1-dehydrogenase [Sphingobium chlorophenolicum]KEQ52722.1 3-oxoacyl-(Acyl-carrier-protein) reductase [Sphingobium chlorophenolicum]